MSKANAKKDWLASIVERSGIDRTRVEAILAEARIQASPVTAAPKRLQIVEIRFSGEKAGTQDDGPFEFEWLELKNGLWGLVSDENLKGKTTVFEVVRWLLKGQPSSNLQDDVRGWITDAALRFQIEDVDYLVQFQVNEGLSGRLSRVSPKGQNRKIASFTNEAEFAATMSDFFMRQFSIDPIPIYRKTQKGQGATTLHDWQAASGVMFVGTNYDTLLGELPVVTGLPPKLLQVFLGLPWVSTHTSVGAALRECKRQAEHDKDAAERAHNSRTQRMDELAEALNQKRHEFEGLSDPGDSVDQLTKATARLAQSRNAEVKLVSSITRARNALSQAESAHLTDKRDLQAHADSAAANAVFRSLNPTCCPRCDKTISAAKKAAEVRTHDCSVCGRKIGSDEDATIIEAQLRQRLKASQKSLKDSKKTLRELEKELDRSKRETSESETSIKALSAKVEESSGRVQVEKEIAVLEARLEELDAEHTQPSNRLDALKVLEAAEKETKSRFEEVQAALLDEVSARIVEFSRSFGMTLLTEASLKGNLNLSLVKGGRKTSYSKVTPGEKLRLKVATVLALISVGETQGVGRYPGVLLIDSPGNNELVSSDLDQLIAGLDGLTGQFEHLQVFVASTASEAVLKHLPEKNQIRARSSESIW